MGSRDEDDNAIPAPIQSVAIPRQEEKVAQIPTKQGRRVREEI